MTTFLSCVLIIVCLVATGGWAVDVTQHAIKRRWPIHPFMVAALVVLASWYALLSAAWLVSEAFIFTAPPHVTLDARQAIRFVARIWPLSAAWAGMIGSVLTASRDFQ